MDSVSCVLIDDVEQPLSSNALEQSIMRQRDLLVKAVKKLSKGKEDDIDVKQWAEHIIKRVGEFDVLFSDIYNLMSSPINTTPSNKPQLRAHFTDMADCIEVGVDEAGRGPLFGPVYAAAVVLPKHSDTFDYSCLKDSKQFSSKKKIEQVADYIKKNALAYSIAFVDESTIDRVNIRVATQLAMHRAIQNVMQMLKLTKKNAFLLIDGDTFCTEHFASEHQGTPFQTVINGDNTYCSIAAASILAKVARDAYIDDLCESNPDLKEKYSIHTNKGYGAKVHLDGIRTHGLSPWHRRTFGLCKQFK